VCVGGGGGGATENAGLELDGQKTQGWKLKDQCRRHKTWCTYSVDISKHKNPTQKNVHLSERIK